ncbi:hypothetical protein [uncultured Brevibacillus sp.]|uniref:hypothetical protein n=1 Tax=uncultured Brevibacillus sp. TaxID=169970 RepID=UPI002595972B|nr:hypothetical protein [uncultured Brevibacillus sp.]
MDTSNPQAPGIARYGVDYTPSYDPNTGVVMILQSGTPSALPTNGNSVDTWGIQVIVGGQTIQLYINQDLVAIGQAPNYTITKNPDSSPQG